jgi:type IV pilus assembly protein PilO
MWVSQFKRKMGNIGAWPLSVRAVIILLVGIAVTCVSYYLFLQPKVTKLQHAKLTLSTTEHKLREVVEQVKFLPAQQIEYAKNQQELFVYAPQFTSDKLLHQFTKLVTLMKLKLIELTPMESVNTASYQEQPIHFVIEGDFFKVYAFIENFQRLNPLSTFDNLSLTALNDIAVAPKILHLDAKVTVFYAKNN